MGFGSFIKGAVKGLGNVAKGQLTGDYGSIYETGKNLFTGQKYGEELLSGLPFVGEGFAQTRAQEFNAAEAQKNRDFQLYMSNSAHQREMKDLKKAGLNPILAANKGASTGAGSAASVQGMSGGKSSAEMFKSMMNQERQLNSARRKSEQSKDVMQQKMGEQASTNANLNKKMQENIEAEIDRKKMENKHEREKYKYRSPMLEGALESAGALTGIGAGFVGGGLGNVLSGALKSKPNRGRIKKSPTQRANRINKRYNEGKGFKFKNNTKYD
jgi:hypothetical protein